MKNWGCFVLFVIVFSFELSAEHIDKKQNSKSESTRPFSISFGGDKSAEPKKDYYFDCKATGTKNDGSPVDFGKFVMELNDFTLWMSFDGLRVEENSDELRSYLALTARFKDFDADSHRLLLNFAQNEFKTQNGPPRNNALSEIAVEVNTTRPFEAVLSGEGPLKEARLACTPMDAAQGKKSLASTLSYEALREAQFVIKNSDKLFPRKTPEQMARNIAHNLSVAQGILSNFNKETDRKNLQNMKTQTENALASYPNIEKLVRVELAKRVSEKKEVIVE